MLLTIGMIVKNEEKFLSRCLEAIVPLLREVSSELIIADTGSIDHTVEIARQYTDNIFHFEWCDDFAAARNSTLKKAKGEWYMYLDADEIVEDCADLITFFNSGEYRRFNSAILTLRSFNDENSKGKASILVTRLAKIRNDLEFINPIHERFNSINEPYKNLNVSIDHYGYVTKGNEEFIKKKVDRNLKIMFAEEQKKPDDCMNLYNICQAHLLVKDYEAALTYCEKGIKYAKLQKQSFELLFYIRKAQVYFFLKDYQNLLITVDEYFRSKKSALASDIEMYIYKAKCHTFFNGYNEAIEAYKNYINMYRGYQNGLFNTHDLHYSSINYAESNSYVIYTLNLIDLLIKIQDYEQAKTYSNSLDKSTIQETDLLTRKLNQDLEIMKKRRDFSDLPLLYDQLKVEHQLALQEMIEKITEAEHCISAAKAFHEAKIKETPYINFMRLRYLYNNDLMTAADVEAVLNQIDSGNSIFAELAYFTLYSGASIELLNSKFDSFDFVVMPNINQYYSNRWPEHSKTIIFDKKDCYQAEKHLWIALLHERVLVSDDVDDKFKMQLFNEYAGHFKAYLRHTVKDEIWLEQKAFLLPKCLRTGFFCSLAIEYREKGMSVEYVRSLRAALKTEPRFYRLINKLSGEISKSETKKQQDLQEYAKVIKSNILALCEKNETRKALEIIAAYEQLIPDDVEVREIKKRLGSR